MSRKKTSTAPATMPWDKNTTILEAKAWLKENTKEGGECPCCRQRVQFYRRSLTSKMAYVLILMERHFRTSNEWVHVQRDFGVAGGDYAKLREWGLIEAKTEHREDGSKRNGFWCITEKGKLFARGEIRVHKYVEIYNGRPTGVDINSVTISIQDALANKFDYAKLMAGGL